MKGSSSQRLLQDSARCLMVAVTGCSAVAATAATTIFLGGEQDNDNENQLSSTTFRTFSSRFSSFSTLASKKVQCESATNDSDATIGTSPASSNAHDSYPNFSRHGPKSILARYLTPEMYASLKDQQTPKFGTTLEDMIAAGVSLPFGADPPRGVGGVFTGDAECYQTFAPLLHPLIEEYHGVHLHLSQYHADSSNVVRKPKSPEPSNNSPEQKQRARGGGLFKRPQGRKTSRIRRQLTNLNPEHILATKVDPSGNYILYTRMRLARSIRGFAFAPMISRADRRRIEALFRDIVQHEFLAPSSYRHFPRIEGHYVSIMDLTNAQHEDFVSQRICFNDPDDFKIAARLGRDWPDARGVFCSRWGLDGEADRDKESDEHTTATNPIDQYPVSPNLIIWCNYDDHFWIMSFGKGGDVQAVFTRLSEAVNKLELGLLKRDHAFAIDPMEQLGFLNCSPVNVGTGLRASMSVKLIRLGKQDPALFHQILQRLHLEAKSDYAETDRTYTGIFEVANAQRVGKTEVQLINIMIQGVSKLIELEQKLERGEQVTLVDVPEDEEGFKV